MRFVLDASAALSLLLEEDAEGTGHEVGGLFSRGDSAVVPTLFIHEITNVLVTAVRRKRISLRTRSNCWAGSPACQSPSMIERSVPRACSTSPFGTV